MATLEERLAAAKAALKEEEEEKAAVSGGSSGEDLTARLAAAKAAIGAEAEEAKREAAKPPVSILSRYSPESEDYLKRYAEARRRAAEPVTGSELRDRGNTPEGKKAEKMTGLYSSVMANDERWAIADPMNPYGGMVGRVRAQKRGAEIEEEKAHAEEMYEVYAGLVGSPNTSPEEKAKALEQKNRFAGEIDSLEREERAIKGSTTESPWSPDTAPAGAGLYAKYAAMGREMSAPEAPKGAGDAEMDAYLADIQGKAERAVSGTAVKEVEEKPLTDYFTDKEREQYNYLLGRFGQTFADAYIKRMSDTLSQRKGGEIADTLEDAKGPVARTVQTGGFGLRAGFDQFGGGMKQNFSEEALPTSYVQYGSQEVREGLKDAGPKVLGSSLGQMAYDMTTTTGNMLPSMLISGVTGVPALGTASLAASAKGNAYKGAIEEGMSKEDAEAYSTLVGVSEGLLQYFLGGIGKLSKGTSLAKKAAGIEKGFLRFIASHGANAVSEAGEEALQSVLEPIFKAAVTDSSADINWADVAYSGLLGGLTGLAMGGDVETERGNTSSVTAEAATPSPQGEGSGAIPQSPDGNSSLYTREPSEVPPLPKVENAEGVDAQAAETNLAKFSSFNEYWGDLQRRKKAAEFAYDYAEGESVFAASERLKAVEAEERAAINMRSAAQVTPMAEDAETDSITEVPPLPSIESVRQQAVEEERQRAIEKVRGIAEKLGVKVEARSLGEGHHGEYSNGVITINSNSENPVREVFVHELTHHLETSGHYDRLKDMVLRHVVTDMKADVESLKSSIISEYAEGGIELDDAGATRELVAKFCESRLFTDEASIERLARTDRNLFQRVYDWIRDTVAKVGADREARFLIDAQRMYEKALRGADASAGDGHVSYSIGVIDGKNASYGKGVLLDTNLFDRVKPRNWGKVLSEFVYKNLAGKELTMYDADGNAETVHVAKTNDRVTKDGAKNSHKVIDKLARNGGDNVKALATVHLSELLEASGNEITTNEHNHQWMDENGWSYRTVYLQDRSGNIYEAMLNIANGRDRRIIYAINNIRQIDIKKAATDGVVPSTENGRGSHINSGYPDTITEEKPVVKQDSYGTSFDDLVSRSGANTEYEGTEATERLGIKIASPITGLKGAEDLVARQKAAYKNRKLLTKKIKELQPTADEREFAIGLAKGIYSEDSAVVRFGPKLEAMNMDKVRELADYYRANEGFDVDMLSYKRRENTRNEEAIAEKLLSNSDAYHSTGTFSLNFNTMKRNIRRIFGKDAAAINARYFDPVTKNSAERIRFINRMYDRVRKFDLSKSESELVQLVIEGTAVQDQVSKMAPDIREKVMDAAQSTDVAESARDMGLSTEQRKAAEAYSKWLQTQARLEDADVDAEKVDAAAKAYSEAYDDFYAATNDFLVAHGYEPIGYIKGYAPHMQPDQVQTGVAGFLKRMGLDASVTELPTEIAGRTADFKPGKQWNPYFQHRNGTDTQVDAVAGFESYVEYMSNVFYHTDDIQKLRVLSNTLRTKYSDEEISNRISYAKGLYNAPKEVKLDYLIENNRVAPDAVLSEEQVNEKLEEYVSALYDNVKNLSRFGPLVTAIDDYTNKLAGKQTKLDRAIEEGLIGRKALNWGNVLSKRFGESTIVGNLSSALNQMAQLPMVQAELGNKYMLWAIKDMLSGEAGALDHESDFLTGKMGIEGLTEKRKWSDKNSKEKHAKVMDVAAIPFTAVDNLASRLIVRAAYLKSVNEGLSHEKAVAKADDFAEKVVGSRMQGARPMVFESKNIFTKLFTTFQLEVANTWAHISRDLNDDIRHTAETDGKKAAIEKTAKMLSSYTVEAFLMNRLCEALYGGTPAPLDLLGYVVGSVAKGFGESTNAFLVNSILRALGLEDEDEEREFDAEAALTEAGSLVVGDLPYVRNAASMMGYGDSSLPIPELPTDTAKSLWGNIMAMLKGEETDWGDTLNDALNEVTDWLPMGNQIRKTIQGGITVGKGGRYAGDELMYPVDTSGFGGKLTAAKALLFGNSALGAADEYYAADARRLSAKQTETYEQLVGAGEDMDTVYDTIMKVRGVENVADSDADGKEKRDIIRSSDMSDLSKAALFSTLIGDGNDDKFAALMDAGMSWDDCMDIYERHRELGDDESMKKTEMATEFAHWVDDNYDAESAALIKEQFKFWNMMSAEASNYEKFTGAGLSSEASELLADSFGALEPEKGAESVSNIQKYRAIADSDLSDEEKNAALGVVMSEGQLEAWHSVSGKLELDEYIDGLEIAANTTGDKDAEGHTIDYSEKFNVMMAVDKLDMNDSDKEVLFSALGYKSEENIWNTEYEGDDYKTYYYMSDGAKADYNSWCSWMEVSEFEEHYAHMSELSADKDSNGNTINGSLQRKRIEYIDGLDLRADEKCALYRCFYSAKSSLEKCIWYNPYDPTVNWSSKFPTDWT